MSLRRRPHRGHRRSEHHPAVQDVGEQGDQQHQHHRDEQPVEDEPDERQLEHVEPDVGAELGVAHAEGPAVAEQQPGLPLRRGGEGDEQGEEAGGEVAEGAEAVPEQLVEALDVRVDVGRESGRSELVGDEQVDADQRGEREEEEHEQRRLGPDHPPEHVAAAEAVVPQEVDVEAGDGASEDDDQQEQHADGDQDRSARDSPPRPPRGVGGAHHRARS